MTRFKDIIQESQFTSIENLQHVVKYFKKNYDLIMFDKDGTLTKTKSGNHCPNTPDDMEVMYDTGYFLIPNLFGTDTRIVICSNQLGVSKGYMSKEDAWAVLNASAELFNVNFDAAYMAFNDDEMRKPRPGMLNAAMKKFGIEPDRACYIGDMETDREAAENAGCDFYYAKDFFGGHIGGIIQKH